MQPPVSLTFSHGPFSLAYISILVDGLTSYSGIVDQSDIMNTHILFIGHCDLHFMGN